MSEGSSVVIGAGRLGLSLASGLGRAGSFRTIAVVGRRPKRPDFLDATDSVEYTHDPAVALRWIAAGEGTSRTAPLVLIFAVGDDALEETAAEWAERLSPAPAADPLIALHTSGFHPSSLIAPLSGAGARLGTWHPLTALAEPSADAFAGVTVGVEGEAPAVEWARVISHDVGASPVEIPAEGKARYHAAAVFASNYLVACLSIALSELEAVSGGALDESALLPLARAAIDNVGRCGIVAGTTGPLVRGDVRTIAGHLEALDPDRAALYRALGRELLAVTRQRNPPDVYGSLSALLAAE